VPELGLALKNVIDSIPYVDFYKGKLSIVVFGYGGCLSLTSYLIEYGSSRIGQVILLNPLFSRRYVKSDVYLSCQLDEKEHEKNIQLVQNYVNLAFDYADLKNIYTGENKLKFFASISMIGNENRRAICLTNEDYTNYLNLLDEGVKLYSINGLMNVFYDGNGYLHEISNTTNIVSTENMDSGYLLMMEDGKNLDVKLTTIMKQDYPVVNELDAFTLMTLIYVMAILMFYCTMKGILV